MAVISSSILSHLKMSPLVSPFGTVITVWGIDYSQHPRVERIFLSSPLISAQTAVFRDYPGIASGNCREIKRLIFEILAFLNGEPVNFTLDCLNLSRCTLFQEKVLRIESEIPRGSVSTYRLIANKAAIPAGARAVGNALAVNPFPLVIPCHRAIRSDRQVGGFQGGKEMKIKLLQMEGRKLDDKGRIIGEFHRFKPVE